MNKIYLVESGGYESRPVAAFSTREQAQDAARMRAWNALAARMTPAQLFAFQYPTTAPEAAQDARFSHLADEKPGDTAWRVVVIVDAAPDVFEGWPCWHATAVYGELRKGIARPAAPLFRTVLAGDKFAPWEPDWPNMRFVKAEALLRRELAGVGMGMLTLNTRDPERQALIDEAHRRGASPDQVVGVSARIRLSVAEAQACLPGPWLKQFTQIEVG